MSFAVGLLKPSLGKIEIGLSVQIARALHRGGRSFRSDNVRRIMSQAWPEHRGNRDKHLRFPLLETAVPLALKLVACYQNAPPGTYQLHTRSPPGIPRRVALFQVD